MEDTGGGRLPVHGLAATLKLPMIKQLFSSSFLQGEAVKGYDAAQVVVETHRRICAWLRAGVTLPQIDAQIAKILEELGAKSAFKGYKPFRDKPPFPSHACLSVNECVVHGTAAYFPRALQAGDVLKIDIGAKYRGFIGDVGWTYSIGEPTAEVRKLMDVSKESLQRGIKQLVPGNRLEAFARAVQTYVENENGLFLVRGLGGHGYGRELHGGPFVSNTLAEPGYDWADATTKCKPGMFVAVEPMLAIGTGRTKPEKGTWPVFSADDSMTAHHEHDVLVTEDGNVVLSEGMDELCDVITRV